MKITRFAMIIGCCAALCAVFLASVWILSPNMCSIAFEGIAAGQKTRFRCFEFWVNRYQAMLAVAAAVITAYIYWRQLRTMDRTREISDKQLAVSELHRLVSRYREHAKIQGVVDDLYRIRRCMVVLHDYETNSDIEPKYRLQSSFKAFGPLLPRIERAEARLLGGADYYGHFRECKSIYVELQTLAENFDGSRVGSYYDSPIEEREFPRMIEEKLDVIAHRLSVVADKIYGMSEKDRELLRGLIADAKNR